MLLSSLVTSPGQQVMFLNRYFFSQGNEYVEKDIHNFRNGFVESLYFVAGY